ncbi:MAG: DEAD/DEAH box helicase [Ignavibacteriales bacterium]|nr:DEAD/DEAH box helicase [Ignavibacteriales bacterium]
MHAISDLGFTYCTPIQAEILPTTLKGDDATGKAQTGTGKTAAFLLTILTHFIRNPKQGKRPAATPRALILAPTRELVLQIEKDARLLSPHMRCKIVALIGGMDYQKQMKALTEREVDIVIATPGRLLDFKSKGKIFLKSVEILVIDEADRMLDMGFIPDVRKIVESTPPKSERQTMFFSATLTSTVKRLGDSWTRNAIAVEIEPEQVAVDTVDQMVYITTNAEKFKLLYNYITQNNLERVIVFGNRRDETRDLKDKLTRYGITSALLSGDVTQDQRIKRLEDFRGGKFRVLVATDVAARGLHIEGVSHVINYNLSQDPEDYVHRIGRTGRAGASGTSVSFASEDDAHEIPKLEEFLGQKMSFTYPKEEWLAPLPKPGPHEKSTEHAVPRRRSSSSSSSRRPPRRRSNR